MKCDPLSGALGLQLADAADPFSAVGNRLLVVPPLGAPLSFRDESGQLTGPLVSLLDAAARPLHLGAPLPFGEAPGVATVLIVQPIKLTGRRPAP